MSMEVTPAELWEIIAEKVVQIHRLEGQLRQAEEVNAALFEQLPKKVKEKAVAMNAQSELERRQRAAAEWEAAHPQKPGKTREQEMAEARARTGTPEPKESEEPNASAGA